MGELGLFSLEKEELWGHLTAPPSAYGCHQEGRAGLSMMVHGGRIKDYTHKQEVQIRCETFPPHVQSSTMRREAVQAPSLEVLSTQLDMLLSILV